MTIFLWTRVVLAMHGTRVRVTHNIQWLGYKQNKEPAETLPQHFIRRYDQAATRKRRGDILVAELMYLDVEPHF
jgi:hypothetical protein